MELRGKAVVLMGHLTAQGAGWRDVVGADGAEGSPIWTSFSKWHYTKSIEQNSNQTEPNLKSTALPWLAAVTPRQEHHDPQGAGERPHRAP